MNEANKDKSVDQVISILNARDKTRKTLPTKVPFQDDAYNINPHAAIFYHYQYLDNPLSTEMVNRLLENKDHRIQELKQFLKRHSVNVVLDKNDYHELDIFLTKHMELDSPKANGLWESLMIDLALYVGEYKLSLFPEIHWGIDAIMGNGPLFLESHKYSYGIANSFIDYGILVSRASSGDKSELSLGGFLTENVDAILLGHKHPTVLSLRKHNNTYLSATDIETFHDDKYVIRDDLTFFRMFNQVDSAEKVRTHKLIVKSIEDRKKHVALFYTRNSIAIDVEHDEYSQLESFLHSHITASFKDDLINYDISDLWLSIILDSIFFIASEKLLQYPNLRWKIERTGSANLIMQNAKSRDEANFVYNMMTHYATYPSILTASLQEAVYQYLDQPANVKRITYKVTETEVTYPTGIPLSKKDGVWS